MPKVTDFSKPPQLPQLEEETQAFWEESDAFKKSVEMRPADKAYVFYDGPPFATGLPHYGHLLASTTKDVIPRYWTMKGYRVNRVWGWDCHGLPIENMIEQKLKLKGGKKGIEELGIGKFNDACQTEVLRLDKEWEKIIGRLGRWVDFENNYKTMDTSFMESVWWGFKQLHEKELVYQGKKVILYCSRCATPLSNFEIAMDNSYQQITEPSTTYKYKVNDEKDTYLLAWSTTPWNKIVTPALAVNPDLSYVKVTQNDEYYILAEDRLSHLSGEYEVAEKFTGRDLESFTFKPHYDFFADERTKEERIGVIVADNFVTAENGTGIVTLAVYGEDDYRVMSEQKIQLVEHVDDQGRLKDQVKPWAGKTIAEVNPLVDADLEERGLLYNQETVTHSVATCYRCGTRLYYAPLPAWFIDVQQLKQNLLDQNKNINWYPEHLKNGRFGKGLENAPDWNISRSRYWGTPMPIWTSEANDIKKIRVIGSIEELQKWAVDPKQAADITDIHRQYIDHIQIWVDDAKTIKGTRIPEVFDCWVESGSMPFASVHYPFENKEFFEQNYPAQFISEYIAQTRAWFYTMHVMSVGVFGTNAYENVLTTGTILAEDGSKMSKSKKNYPDPMLLINKYGVDSLRLYLMSSTVMKSENLNFSEKDVSDIRRKVFVIWWNTLSFYKSFADQSQPVTKLPKKLDHVMDQWLASSITSLVADVTQHMDNYDVVRASRSIMEFVNSLSTWYLRLSRNRLRGNDTAQPSGVFGYALYTLAQLAAPITPFFAELVHHNMVDEHTSIHHSDWPQPILTMQNKKLEEEMEQLQKVTELAHAARKNAEVKVRQPLASVTVTLQSELENQESLAELLAQEVNVKQVKWNIAKQSQLEVKYDLALTPELKKEGDVRELIRNIQKLRRKAGLKVGDTATVQAPEWPEGFKSEIEEATGTSLQQGIELQLISK
jgi:isoleucyl-tRNA synthetase